MLANGGQNHIWRTGYKPSPIWDVPNGLTDDKMRCGPNLDGLAT